MRLTGKQDIQRRKTMKKSTRKMIATMSTVFSTVIYAVAMYYYAIDLHKKIDSKF
jgi:hypothetical protein